MTSCWRETIPRIGTVIVGTEESVVHLADYHRARRRFGDPNQANRHHAGDTSAVAATVLRSMDCQRKTLLSRSHSSRSTAPPRRLWRPKDAASWWYGASTFPASVRRSISAAPSSREGSSISPARTSRWRPAAPHRVTFKSSQIVFRVDAQAKPGATPIVGRLLRMD